MTEVSKEDAIKRFGFDPETIGRNHEEWWVVDVSTQFSLMAGAKIGDLGVRTTDGNDSDEDAMKKPNFIGTAFRRFLRDRELLYYYFSPLPEEEKEK